MTDGDEHDADAANTPTHIASCAMSAPVGDRLECAVSTALAITHVI